jgi:phytoene dehydrogenase-like protein
MDNDAIVVGAGPNGLSAAITLAAAGVSVTVFEAASTIGGGCRSAELTRPGFVHDVCSAIHPLVLASPFLSSLPLDRHGVRWAHSPSPLAHPLDDGTAALLERSVEATAQGLGKDGAAYARLMHPLARNGKALAAGFLAPPLGMPRHPLLMARFGLSAIRSAAGLARARFQGDKARALLGGVGAHSMLALDEPITAGVGIVLGLLAHTVGWPLAVGGAQRISDALAAHLESLGGKIVTDRRVGSLAELPPARAVLLDVSPRHLSSIAGDLLPERYRRKLARFRYGPGIFKVDWALDGPVPWTAKECERAATVHLGGALEDIAASEKAVSRGQLPVRPFVLFTQQSLFDRTRAPEGKHTAWAYCHVPHGSTADMTGPIEAQVERFAPGFKDLILERHTVGPADLESYDANYIGGDINGGRQDLRQHFARPVLSLTPYSTPTKDLYLCSSSTPPGGGVHGMCGHLAARAALKRSF